MSNIFSGDSHDLDLSNGATAVFVDVLMLAVSDLASEDWDFRFAALLTLQDQNVMGRGAVGFDLAESDYLHRFTVMVESCAPSADSGAARGFPGPDEAAMASCVRHRVLSALPLWDGCFLCNRPHC
ncbi:hypothetical protein ACX6XY_16280 [Streptomyces sp. O3]